MKKAWKILSTVLAWIIVVVAVLMMIFTIVAVNTFDRNDRNLFGYRCYIVLSDSMAATDFDAGDLVLVKAVDPSTLQEGDIISYQSQDMDNYGQTVTHKIRAKTTDANGNPGFITYGTTTDVNDQTVVTYPFILGKYQMALPKVGTFFQFLKTPMGYVICILIPFLLLIGYQGLNCVKMFRLYKAEQIADLQALVGDRLEARTQADSDWGALGTWSIFSPYTAGKGEAPRYAALILYMPEEVGNRANYRGLQEPSVELGITVLAQQVNKPME